MNPPISGTRRRFALLGLVGIVAVFSFVPEALANPSQIQYGYDPIVDAGGSKPDQSGSEGAAPAENVDRASAVVAEIVGVDGGEGREGAAGRRGSRDGDPRTGSARGQEIPALSDSSPERDSSAPVSGSLWLFAVILGLSMGLVAWAVRRRRDLGKAGLVDLTIRTVSLLAFLAMIIFLNGAVGSILS